MKILLKYKNVKRHCFSIEESLQRPLKFLYLDVNYSYKIKDNSDQVARVFAI